MDLSLDLWLRVLTFAVLIGSTATNVVLYVKTRSDKRFDELAAAIKSASVQQHTDTDAIRREVRADYHGLALRISVVEEWRKHVPTDDDMNSLRNGLADFSRQLSAVDERSKTTLNVVARIEQYLMERPQ